MGQACKILIVEDELITRQALRYIIGSKDKGFEIIGEASNGKEAIQIIEKEVPHIIICDIVMPVMNGIELTKFIKLKYPGIHIIILSSHGDFDYVKSTFQYGIFDYILKPQLEPEYLLNMLYKIAESLNIDIYREKEIPLALHKEVIIKRIIQDKDYSVQDEELKKTFKNPLFCLLGCQLRQVEGYRKSKERFYSEAILEIVREYLEEIVQVSMITDKSILLILLNFDEVFSKYNTEKLQSIIKSINISIPKLTFAVGETFKDLSELQHYGNKVKKILDLKFYLEEGDLIFSQDVQVRNQEIEFNQKSYMDNMRISLKVAFQMFIGFLEGIDTTNFVNEIELKRMVENTLYNTLNLLEELNFNMEEISARKMDMFSQISTTKNIRELRMQVKDILHSIYKMIDEQKTVEKDMLNKMYDYIDKHYNEQITLNTLSHVFHLSYSYLSSYFSTATHKGFNEYLSEVRINKAKELLCCSDTPISDISEMVGYSDQSYFSKVFKKITAYSPSEYRRLYAR